jgi:YggT family protein
MCEIDQLIVKLFYAYTVVLLIYALLSWVPDLRGSWTRYLDMLVEPVLAPIRRIVPPIGGFDMAFLIVILLINFIVIPLLETVARSACYQ